MEIIYRSAFRFNRQRHRISRVGGMFICIVVTLPAAVCQELLLLICYFDVVDVMCANNIYLLRRRDLDDDEIKMCMYVLVSIAPVYTIYGAGQYTQ